MAAARTTAPPGKMDEATVSILQAQISQMGDRMEAGFCDIKNAVAKTAQDLNQFMLQEAAARPAIVKDIEALKTDQVRTANDQDAQDKRIDAVEDAIKELKHTNKILSWILGIFTAVLVSFLVALVTGNLVIMAVP